MKEEAKNSTTKSLHSAHGVRSDAIPSLPLKHIILTKKPATRGQGPSMSNDDSSDDEDNKDQHQFKVILLGDGAVGKTSIAMRFCNDHFAQQYKQTIGLDFFMKRLVLPGEVNVAMQVWDIGGQSIGGKMIKNYIYGAHAVLLCYDITSKESFQNLEDWYRLVRKTFEKSKLPYVALVGNKTDMSHARAVSRDKHNAFVEENDMYSYFMSAKTGDMVSSSLFRIAADLAGIVLTKGEVDVTVKPVTAAIVDYERHDTQEKRGAKVKASNNNGGCKIS